jgi:hypothetical protein
MVTPRVPSIYPFFETPEMLFVHHGSFSAPL